jgi:uncharacterized protein YyaL (SSP411 family)
MSYWDIESPATPAARLTTRTAARGPTGSPPKDATMSNAHENTAADINWRDWSPETLAAARDTNKLILLDSGATWCHWCHVMDRVTYEDPDVIDLVSQRFIAVRIDRDRRPELDAWLQRTPTVVRGSGYGGWPLTVVLTPNATPLWRATFLPPRSEGQYGPVPGLIDVLQRLDEIWREKHEAIARSAAQFRQQGRHQLDAAYDQPGTLSAALVDRIAVGIKGEYDAERGGFGHAPKFFNATSLELLLMRAWAGDAEAEQIVTHSLTAMADGGVHDQVAGGFHRYSVDRRWHVPHFEKMAYDNAALLDVYASACALTGEERFAEVARGIVAWLWRDLSGDAGFYASQNADVGLDDDGDFFTWTVEEMRDALGEDAELAMRYYGVDAEGDMDARPGRNVLHVTMNADELAAKTGRPVEDIHEALQAGRQALLPTRRRRATPSIDTTVFADLNGMLISALLRASGHLGEKDWADVAVTYLEALLDSHRNAAGVFGHYIDDGELHNVGLLADQAWMLRALLDTFQHANSPEHLQAARVVGDFIIDRLVGEGASLVCRPQVEAPDPTVVAPRRSWDDAPIRSAASVAAAALADLGWLTGEPVYTEAARRGVESFAGVDSRYGTFLGGYGMAVDRLLYGPRSVTVVSPGGTAGMVDEARRRYLPHKVVLRLKPGDPAQKAVLDQIGYAPVANGAVAYVCGHTACLAPAGDTEELRHRLDELRQRTTPRGSLRR